MNIIGTIKSNLPHPVVISYGSEAIRISPNGTIREVIFNQLGMLPKGVLFIRNN